MLDLVRFLFAILVLIEHLSGSDWTLHFGKYGVWGFYMISGYLMTGACRRTYGFSANGTGGYFLNRFLRIYPTYYLVVLIAVSVLYCFGGQLSIGGWNLQVPTTPQEYVAYILIVPWVYAPGSGLIPPQYSLGIEVIYYFVIFLILARSFRLTALITFSAVVYTLYLVCKGAGPMYRYLDPKPCVLPFAIGALLWFLDERQLLSRFGFRLFLGALAAFLLNLGFAALSPFDDRMMAPFYANLLIVSLLVTGAVHSPIKHPVWKPIGKFIGKLTYPFFLIHLLAGVLVAHLLLGTKEQSWVATLLTVPVALILSAIIVHFVDEPLNGIRDAVKDILQRRQSPAPIASSASI